MVVAMAAETSLPALLAGLDPMLHDEVLVYLHLPTGTPVPSTPAFATVVEAEGTTLVVGAGDADRHGLDGTFPCRRIELRVHSALEAVGLTAAVSAALTTAGIPANVIAAFHHDHVLVPADRADDALAVLTSLAAQAG